MIVDKRLENKKHVAKFVKQYSLKRVQVLAYHPQANRIIERGHKPIVEALAYITNSKIRN